MSDKANWIGTTEIDDGNAQHTGTHRFTGGSKFVIADATDATKTVIFNLSGLPTETQTEFTVPDSDSSLVTLTATQTLTNKTLTSPVITGLTLTSPTISTSAIINGTLNIIEGGSSPTKYTIFQGGDQSVDITYTLPTGAPAANGDVLSSTTAGVMSWTTFQTLASGVWTPTLTSLNNIGSSTTAEGQYLRVGSTVTCSGKVTVAAAAGGSAELQISVPIASNFGTTQDCAGTAFSPTIASVGAAVIAQVANNAADMKWVALDTTSSEFFYTFSYQII